VTREYGIGGILGELKKRKNISVKKDEIYLKYIPKRNIFLKK